jgi:hypothetical protein
MRVGANILRLTAPQHRHSRRATTSSFPPRHNIVIPAQAGIHWLLTVAKWIPAFAGMTLVWYEPGTWFTPSFRLSDRL